MTHPTPQSFPSFKSLPSQPTRIGKIARLPETIRQQVNQRLRDAQPDSQILPWLNALPEVSEILTRHFHGKPIHKVNLHAWRNGGFADDQAERQHVARLKELTSFSASVNHTNADQLAQSAMVLASAQLLELFAAMKGQTGNLTGANRENGKEEKEFSLSDQPKNSGSHPSFDLKRFTQLIKSLVSIRREQISQQRTRIADGSLQCQKARLKLSQDKYQHKLRQCRQKTAQERREQRERRGSPSQRKYRRGPQTAAEAMQRALDGLFPDYPNHPKARTPEECARSRESIAAAEARYQARVGQSSTPTSPATPSTPPAGSPTSPTETASTQAQPTPSTPAADEAKLSQDKLREAELRAEQRSRERRRAAEAEINARRFGSWSLKCG